MNFKEWLEKYYPRESKYVLQRMSHAWVAGHTGTAMRLVKIAEIIDSVNQRCMAVDGAAPTILSEMTQEEMSEIYELASMPHNQQIHQADKDPAGY